MKKITMIMALMAVLVVGAVAQPRKLSKEDQERVFNGKAQAMQKGLGLSEEQMVKFLPIYREFQDEVMNVRRNRIKGDTLTMEVAYAEVVSRLEYQENIIDIQKKTLAELKSVLTPVQLRKFLGMEYKVQKDIMKHKKGRKSGEKHKKTMMKHKKKEYERRCKPLGESQKSNELPE